ncbi:15-hydroxyprostaglandin dehydrogenase [NAD(+)]-like [Thalassophryne amazonica]|uniref:15-hydroxyprostaglandin dehydrogenase [NAD(+)]-like n=1 Tax=Thalassophryne amazonica TaxID=390379 RepID=UPI001471B595|nr:15-hydroxyprostaglandin dehydrogenase [NAD(+)]-like [Thalassophryne amazonica]
MSLNGKTAVVTGAAQGIGKAFSEILLQKGAKVALLDVNETKGQSLKEAFVKDYGHEKTLFLNCDVQSEEQFKAAFQKAVETFGGIDIMCNNAGILNEAQWEKCVSINLMSFIRGSYLALEHMNKLTGGQGGVIVNIASIAGLTPIICCPVYTAAKHGVVGFTRAMALASAASGYGVRFNALCPTAVETEFSKTVPNKSGPFSHLIEGVVKSMQGIGLLKVTEVADCVLELVMDEMKNGEIVLVSPQRKANTPCPVLFPPTLVDDA